MLQAEKYDVNFVGSKNTNDGGPPILQDFDTDHNGAAGLSADQLLIYLPEWLAYAQPNIVLVFAGVNDLFTTSTAESTVDDIGKIIDMLRAFNPRVKVLVGTLLPTTYRDNNIHLKIPVFNALLPALVRAKTTVESPVVLVDHHTGFRIEDLYDGIHPTPRGEEIMAERWLAALKTDVMLGGRLPLSSVQFSARPKLTIHPVPADRLITVSGIASPAPIIIWNGRGQVVYRQPAHSTQLTVDISQFSQGLYTLQSGAQRTRFIKY
jgi:lysophospholipase L1-like esterase